MELIYHFDLWCGAPLLRKQSSLCCSYSNDFLFAFSFRDFLVQKISAKANTDICCVFMSKYFLFNLLYVKIMHYGDTTSRPQYVLQHSIQTRQDLCIDSKQAHHTLYSTSLVACLLACLSGVIATSSQAVVDCIGCCLHQQQVKSRSKRLVAYMAVCVRNG